MVYSIRMMRGKTIALASKIMHIYMCEYCFAYFSSLKHFEINRT